MSKSKLQTPPSPPKGSILVDGLWLYPGIYDTGDLSGPCGYQYTPAAWLPTVGMILVIHKDEIGRVTQVGLAEGEQTEQTGYWGARAHHPLPNYIQYHRIGWRQPPHRAHDQTLYTVAPGGGGHYAFFPWDRNGILIDQPNPKFTELNRLLTGVQQLWPAIRAEHDLHGGRNAPMSPRERELRDLERQLEDEIDALYETPADLDRFPQIGITIPLPPDPLKPTADNLWANL